MPTTSIQFPLDRGERQLWAGMPPQGLRLQPFDAFMIPFSCLWAGFAVYWEYSVIESNAPVAFRLFGIPFVLMGVYITVGRFWADARRRARTAYAITTDRVIIQSGVGSATTESIDLRTLSNVTLKERRDGSGTITLGATASFAALQTAAWPGYLRVPQLEGISDARRVYDILREAQKTALSGPSLERQP